MKLYENMYKIQQLIQQLAGSFQKQNAELLAQFQELSLRIQDSQQIESFEDLQKFDKKGADALSKLSSVKLKLCLWMVAISDFSV